jgi:mono/diheme cytochrome c family protein
VGDRLARLFDVSRSAPAWVALLVAFGCARGETGRADRLAQGHEVYLTYCVACHGADGSGGPVAPYLSPPPRDLKGLAARNGGTFPRMLIEGWIDGRETLGAHGTREMPVWGRSFWEEEEWDEDTEARVHAKVALLVEYLESIQRQEPQ